MSFALLTIPGERETQKEEERNRGRDKFILWFVINGHKYVLC